MNNFFTVNINNLATIFNRTALRRLDCVRKFYIFDPSKHTNAMENLKKPATLITKTIATEVTDISAVTNDFKVYTFNYFSFNAYANLNLRHEGNKLSFVSCSLTFEEDECGNHPGTVMNKGSEEYQRFLNYARETAYNLADAEMLKLIQLGL